MSCVSEIRGLDEIPTTAAPPLDSRPSGVVARLRALRPGRRAVLRGLVIGAATTALVPIDWFLTRRGASAAPADAPDDRSEYTECRPAEYDEEANNWWEGGPAVCYGGWRRGSYPCEGGFHREGEHAAMGESYTSTRLTSSCSGRNGWRWKGYRCSDAVTTATYADGTEYTGTTIAACPVDGSAPPPAEPDDDPAPAPDAGTDPDTGSDAGTDPDTGSDPSTPSGSGGSEDPSRPRRETGLLPGLGVGMESLPGLGALFGR